MSNPNTRVAGILDRSSISSDNCHNDLTNSAITSGKLNTFNVGKNQYHISAIQLSEISEITCKKKSGSDLLTSSVAYLSGGHIVSYLITLVENEVPMDTYSALQDLEKQIMKVMKIAFIVDNLSASAFVNAAGKVIKLASERLQDMPS